MRVFDFLLLCKISILCGFFLNRKHVWNFVKLKLKGIKIKVENISETDKMKNIRKIDVVTFTFNISNTGPQNSNKTNQKKNLRHICNNAHSVIPLTCIPQESTV